MNNDVRFIADIGSNHNGNLTKCLSLIRSAKNAGCWGVKFQLFKGNQLYRNAPEEIVKNLIERELPIDWIPEIKKECNKLKIKFGCSPFYLEAVDVLKNYVDFLKISSFDIMRKDLIQKCVNTKLPMMISLGCVSNENEVKNLISKLPFNTILFHCVSKYPTRYQDVNLMTIKWMKHCYGRYIGWSDHTVEPGVIYQAVANGAEYIEFHLDDVYYQGWESGSGHCWNINIIKPVIETVKLMKKSEGKEYNDFFKKDAELKRVLRASASGLRDY